MPLILDNDFTHDTHNRRTVRLSLMSSGIDAVSVELALAPDILTWAQGAYAAWMDVIASAGIEKGERDMAFESYHALLDEARDYYISAKELLWALIEDTEDGIEIGEKYGIMGRTPESLGDFLGAVKKFKVASDELRTAGDPRVLSTTIVDNVVAKTDTAHLAFQTAQNERKESLEAFDALADLYAEDCQKLRLVYSHAALTWGKYSPNMVPLGFAPAVVRPGGGQPDAPVNFGYADGTFSWDEVEGATSYQLVYSADGDVWDEAYSGEETSFAFNPGVGNLFFRVRARDADGYSPWSLQISVKIEEGGGVEAPQNLSGMYDVGPPANVKLNWDAVTGAGSYNIYRSVVPMGQPSGSYSSIGSTPSNAYEDTAVSPGMTHYYYVTALNGAEESDPSNVVSVDVQ